MNMHLSVVIVTLIFMKPLKLSSRSIVTLVVDNKRPDRVMVNIELATSLVSVEACALLMPPTKCSRCEQFVVTIRDVCCLH